MKDMNDDELQAWLESQFQAGEKPPGPETEEDAVQLYRQIFEELSTKPPASLSYGFSSAVVRKIQQKEVIRKERRAYVVFGCCLLLMPLVALAMQAVFRNTDLAQTFRAINAIKFPALFVVLLLSLIQWADYRFVKRKLNS